MATETRHGAQAGPEAAQLEPDDESAVSEFVRQFGAAWATSDPDALAARLTEDVVLIQPGMPPTVGKAAAREGMARLLRLIPDLHVRVHRWAARNEVVFIEFTLIGTFGGKELSWPAVDRLIVRDGLIAERISYFDPLPIFLATVGRPRGWRRLFTSGFRPSFSSGRKER
jgi:ketosteroid isomerase-like protein